MQDLTDVIFEYLKNTFNVDFSTSFIRNTIINMIDYAVENFNHGKDQLAHYLSDIIDELTFEEIKKIIDDYKKEVQ